MWKELTEEERDLLMSDLSGRIKYDTVLDVKGEGEVYLAGVDWWGEVSVKDWKNELYDLADVRPYLRPVGSMSKEERKEACELGIFFAWGEEGYVFDGFGNISGKRALDAIKWLNSHYLDWMGLIGRGLARVAKEGMYKTE